MSNVVNAVVKKVVKTVLPQGLKLDCSKAVPKIIIPECTIPHNPQTWTPNTPRCGALAFKLGMMSYYDGWGQRHPVTVLHLADCTALQFHHNGTHRKQIGSSSCLLRFLSFFFKRTWRVCAGGWNWQEECQKDAFSPAEILCCR